MVPKIATLYKRDPRYKAMNYLCVGCSVGGRGGARVDDAGVAGGEEAGGEEALNRSLDTIPHVLRCSAYSEYRHGLNLNLQTDVLKYFQLVINKRTEDENT